MLYILCIAAVLAATQQAHILSRPIRSLYNKYGAPTTLLLQFKPESPLYNTDYLQVSLPEPIHNSTLMVQYSLHTANSQDILLSQYSEVYIGGNVYFLAVREQLQAHVWYQLRLRVDAPLAMVYGLVGLAAVGREQLGGLIWAANQGLEYFHLQTMVMPNLTSLAVTVASNPRTNAGDHYEVLLSVTSAIDALQPITLFIQFIDSNQLNTTPTASTPDTGQDRGFTFMGQCSTLCPYNNSNYTCMHQTQCQVTPILIKLVLPYMRAGQSYLVQLYVINPIYVSSVGLELYWQYQQGDTMALAYADRVLEVLPISITGDEIRLLWGIPYNVATVDMDLGIFLNDPAVKHQSLTSFDIGFRIATPTPVQSQFTVVITIGASSVLQSSIIHNLPSLQTTTTIDCRYLAPNIVCTGVDAFMDAGLRYYVRGRGNFQLGDNLAAFGDVEILSVGQPGLLFTKYVRGLVVKTVSNADYHDYGGLHEGTSGFRLGETMVVSTVDTLLPNSTSTAVKNFLASGSSFVGVDTSSSPQQLLFFLKVPVAQMSAGLPSQNYTMRVFTNPNIMSSSPFGIEFVAYSPVTGNWQVQNTACYVDNSATPTMQDYMCQKYNDHVYGRQIDNKFQAYQHYGLYTNLCGSGEQVTCPSADCSTQCQVLKGGFASAGMTVGSAGVLSIRNVRFRTGYTSPVQAGADNLDFVIAFYQAGVPVSATLINAYTLTRARLRNLRASLVNYYHDGVTTNDGSRLPTMLKLSGFLSLSQYTEVKSLRVYLPSALAFTAFIDSSQHTIGCSTGKCVPYEGGLAKPQDTWTSMNSIEIHQLPFLTQPFNILIPVQATLQTIIPQVTVALIRHNDTIASVYRINGSSVMEPLSGVNNAMTLPWVPTTAWAPSSPLWVNTPTHIYGQRIDVATMVPYTDSLTISMGNTSMQAADPSPSTTFACAHVNIFSASTTATINTVIPCASPFSYLYTNLYPVWVLWCPLTANSTNTITLAHPLLPATLGSSYPLQLLLTYAYASAPGQMIGYRVEQNQGGQARACNVQKVTAYDKMTLSPQQNTYVLTMQPFELKEARNKIMVVLVTPASVPMQVVACRAGEVSSGVGLSCGVVGQVGSNCTMELSYGGAEGLMVYELEIVIKTVRTGAPTIINNEPFSVRVVLPMTDANGSASLTGTLYSPYITTIASCNNSFTFTSVSGQEYIQLTEPLHQIRSTGYYGTLTFRAGFGATKTTLFASSQLVLTFSAAVLSPTSQCLLSPGSHPFASSVLTPSSATLTPKSNIPGFTLTAYTITCTHVVLPSIANLTANLLWRDGIYNMQTTLTDILFDMSTVPVATPLSASLDNRWYGSSGYIGQYQLSAGIPTVPQQSLQLYITFADTFIYAAYLQCSILVNSTWQPVLCYSPNPSQLCIRFQGLTLSSIQVSVYGVHQQPLPTTMRILAIVTDLLSNAVSYHASGEIVAAAAGVVINEPIIIHNISVQTSTPEWTEFALIYSMPITTADPYYIQVDQLLTAPTVAPLLCSIDNTTVPCLRIRTNLVYVDCTAAAAVHNLGQMYRVVVSGLAYRHQLQYDTEEVHFRLFVVGAGGADVAYGSHQHAEETVMAAELVAPEGLLWELPTSPCLLVYLGYYAEPALLLPSTRTPLRQSFSLALNSSLPLLAMDLSAELGLPSQPTWLSTLDPSTRGYQLLPFLHNSSYPPAPPLPVFISTTKCTLTPQFSEYTIVSPGVSIPIFVNTTLCRPVQQMQVSVQVDNTVLLSDGILSTDYINSTTKGIYIVVRIQAGLPVGSLFNLQIVLQSSNTIVQSAYNPISNVSIRVIDRGLLIGNPEGKQPITNYVTYNQASFQVQCNAPATIYWAVGQYPTLLGISVVQIQARLIDKQNGLVPWAYDTYSWSQQQYGFTYVSDFNIANNITVGGLTGNTRYIFKYYCVDQTGTASGGKISEFVTTASPYSLIKLTLVYLNKLTYGQVNTVACAIAQQLVIPYAEVMSSMHSNCINGTEIYAKNGDSVYDELRNSTNGSALYAYFYYIDTQRMSSQQLTMSLMQDLRTSPIFALPDMPFYTSLSTEALVNNYEPVILSAALTAKSTSTTLSIATNFANSYLIVALMEEVFDPATMSLPAHHLMKEGYFSLGTKFDQIYSIYGRNTMGATLWGLTPGASYTVFYFLTVDNPALNSRYSQMQYRTFVTNKKHLIDLGELPSAGYALLLALTMLVSLYLL